MRHTMNALYSDLSVTLLKVSVNTPRRDQTNGDSVEGNPYNKAERPRLLREKSLLVRFMVTGKTRVSGSPGEWEVYVQAPFFKTPPTLTVYNHPANLPMFSRQPRGSYTNKLSIQSTLHHTRPSTTRSAKCLAGVRGEVMLAMGLHQERCVADLRSE